MRKFILALTVLLGLSFVSAGVASASPKVDPPRGGTDSPKTSQVAPAGADLPGPPLLTRSQALARMSDTAKAELAKNAAQFKGVPAPTLPAETLTASGHTPYGGNGYSDLRIDGYVGGCSAGAATRSTDQRQFVYSAGHCVTNEAGTADVVDNRVGQFYSPYTLCISCQAANLGNTGHGGTHYDAQGDKTFIRANKAWGGTGLYSEFATGDSRIALRFESGSDPFVGQVGSTIGMTTGRLIHGTVGWIDQTVTNIGGHPTAVGNMAIMKIDYTHEGCPQPGDSGGPVISGTHSLLGVATAASHDSSWCYFYFDQAYTSITGVNQQLAPWPPA